MSIESLLRRPVCTLPPRAACQEAAQLLRDEGVGCVVVSEDERPLSIVTDRDLVVRVMAAGLDPGKTLVRDIMSGEPVFLARERSIEQVFATMREQRFRRIPVVDGDAVELAETAARRCTGRIGRGLRGVDVDDAG